MSQTRLFAPNTAATASSQSRSSTDAERVDSTPRILSELRLAHAYRKGRDDIAREFYLPCHAIASSYDRAVGFFSSSVYALAWPSLRQFVLRGGSIRLICSPVLSIQDQEALAEGYSAVNDADVAEALQAEVHRMLADPRLGKPTRVLATLVASGVVSLKLAFLERESDPRSKRIFHDKVGIFQDPAGHRVVFKGSMNETWAGLSADGNLESVDVFVSWGGDREAERVADEAAYFEALWNNEYPTVSVREFPAVAKESLVDSADPSNWMRLVEEICAEIELAGELSADVRPGGRIPRPHQVQALQAWNARGRRGILEHATGSGKTFTGLCAMRDALSRGEVPVVLVPSELLMDQWLAEVHQTFDDQQVRVLACDGRSPNWRKMLGAWTRQGADPRIVVASMTTAAGDDFLNRVRAGSHVFLLADEVHALGSRERRKLFTLDTGARLGLSATPRRAGDPEGTAAIVGYFGEVVPPPFTLRDAIAAGALTRYFYSIHPVALSAAEQEQWDELTNRIRQLYAQGIARAGDVPDIEDRMRILLLNRARIIKRAAGKVPLAVQVLAANFRRGQRWIVYCDSRVQLEAVLTGLREAGLQASPYHSELRKEQREATLAHLAELGGVVVAIRCLDEGVDIPAVDHAVILASSKNPREFVQRRGRVLRNFAGKHFATVHDAIVVPNTAADDGITNQLLAGELARAIEFGRGAENPSSVTDIELLALRFGFELDAMMGAGIEDDASDPTDE